MLQTQLTTRPTPCPKCGRDAKPAGFNLVRCPVHGYTERTPLTAIKPTRETSKGMDV
jgi:tRNA(Ile2) C34 agmatinyltransferase TiaS